ncbi:hypothetical protein [Thermococcus sp.]|uniref:hypothetical protein n=1 Tax=Thermococcus sp. TaxID=35749 RepID=UPI002639B574|nr:hypothetical protein [Thermococcus sp.]
MVRLVKTTVRDEKLWKAGVVFLAFSLALLFIGIATGRTAYSLPNVFIALALLILANRLRVVRVECTQGTFLLVPDYGTSTLILRDSNGNVVLRDFFPLFEEKKLRTPCGVLEVRAIGHRFGKVELGITAESEEVMLP